MLFEAKFQPEFKDDSNMGAMAGPSVEHSVFIVARDFNDALLAFIEFARSYSMQRPQFNEAENTVALVNALAVSCELTSLVGISGVKVILSNAVMHPQPEQPEVAPNAAPEVSLSLEV